MSKYFIGHHCFNHKQSCRSRFQIPHLLINYSAYSVQYDLVLNKCTSTRCGSFLHNYLALAQHYCLDQCLVLALAQYYWLYTTSLFLHNILVLAQHSFSGTTLLLLHNIVALVQHCCSCTTMKTLWIGIVRWISKSTKPCLWVVCELTIPFHSVFPWEVCELSNSRYKLIDFDRELLSSRTTHRNYL